MRFPAIEQLALPVRLEQVVPGRLHPDGKRYLPTLVFALESPRAAELSAIDRLGVVDRHHRVDLTLEGRTGNARLVLLLSKLQLLATPRYGLADESQRARDISTMPTVYGQVLSVPTWQTEQEHLPFEALYTELVLDIGVGIVGVRTNATAADLSELLGKPRIEEGDWLAVSRSRIDILAFEAL